MRKNKGFASLEVMIFSSLAIIVIMMLVDNSMNEKILITKEALGSSLELHKDKERSDFLCEFIQVLNEQKDVTGETDNSNEEIVMYKEELEDITDVEQINMQEEYSNEIIGGEENTEETNEVITIETIQNLLGSKGFIKGKFTLTYSSESDIFLLRERTLDYSNKISYYDYEILQNNLLLKKRRYYDFR